MSEPQQRSWWGRNWKWAVPVGCLLPVLLCGGGITLFITFIFSLIKTSDPYQEAVAKAKNNPAVQAALGAPVTPGFLVMGNINLHNTNGVETGLVNLSIPLSGPKGSGTLRVVGTKDGGPWSYTVLEVIITGQPVPIDLLGEK